MAELVWAINGNANLNRDAHFSAAVSSALQQGVVSGLTITTTSVSSGMALVLITRTSVSPNETFLVPFYLTVDKSITTGVNKKIWIRIDTAKVNDPTLITDPNGANVGVVEVGTSWPASNYVKLAETDGSGNVVTTNREILRLSSLKRSGLTGWRVIYSDVNGNEQEVAFGAAGTAFCSNGPTAAPSFQTPVVSRITGEVISYAWASAPTGWLLCDGSAISRTTYAALFTLIGTTYGVGDGSTTFNVPDFRGRMSLGVGTGTATDATAHALGQKSGEETHVLVISEMPSHTHSMGIQTSGSVSSGTGASGSAASGNTGSQGGNGPHNNMPPFLAINFIIKT